MCLCSCTPTRLWMEWCDYVAGVCQSTTMPSLSVHVCRHVVCPVYMIYTPIIGCAVHVCDGVSHYSHTMVTMTMTAMLQSHFSSWSAQCEVQI